MSQEFGSSSARWFYFKVSDKVAVPRSARIAVIWRLDWGWRSCIQGGLVTQLASWWWRLAGCHRVLHVGLPQVAWVSSWHGSWLPRRLRESRGRMWKSRCLSSSILRNYTLSFPSYSIGHTDQSWYDVGEDYTKAWVTHCGSHFESWLLQRKWKRREKRRKCWTEDLVVQRWFWLELLDQN